MDKHEPHYYVGLDIPANIKKDLPQIGQDPKNYHITLKFLGSLNPEQLENTKTQLQEIVHSHKDFPVDIAGYKNFGKSIFYADVKKHPRLNELQKSMGIFGKDHRKFHPHITLGRNMKGPEYDKSIAEFKASRVGLFRYDPKTRTMKPEVQYNLPHRNIWDKFTDIFKSGELKTTRALEMLWHN
jgi:2'-5' RNA ligase